MGDSKGLNREASPAQGQASAAHPTRTSASITGVTLLLLITMTSLGCHTVQMKLRKPGIHHAGFAHEIADEYGCAERTLPFFAIERNELLPSYLKPGEEFNHRLVYVLCPKEPTQVVAGTLTTRILHKAKALQTDRIQFELEEGRWVMDTFISLPEAAKPGAYALDVEFTSAEGTLEATAPFIVEAN